MIGTPATRQGSRRLARRRPSPPGERRPLGRARRLAARRARGAGGCRASSPWRAGRRWRPIGGGNDLTRKVSLTDARWPATLDLGGVGPAFHVPAPPSIPPGAAPCQNSTVADPGVRNPGDRTPHGRTSPWDSHVRGDPRFHGVAPYSPASLSSVKSRSPPRIGMVKIAGVGSVGRSSVTP